LMQLLALDAVMVVVALVQLVQGNISRQQS
jgi:hypothetical protein